MEAAQAHLSLHMSKCHIVGNLMPRLDQKSEDEDEEEEAERFSRTEPMEHIYRSFYLHLCQ